MPATASTLSVDLDEQTREFYRHAIRIMQEGGLDFLVGGAYAFARYTGIERHTKDFDVFIRPEDWPRAEELFQRAGYRTELTFPHWIGKALKSEEEFVDLIFSAGNGVARVDETWFEHAVPGRVFDMDVKLIPAEEMIWSKGLIMERERFDGADVVHLILALGQKLDWRRLLDRYAKFWRVLYAHMILFGFIYPSERDKVPAWAMDELAQRLAREVKEGPAKEKTCYGTILSRQQYLIDVDEWGYRDARLEPIGKMSAEEIARWTAGIDVDGHK
jgi:hypothetical protein